jgi:hypothetical protein
VALPLNRLPGTNLGFISTESSLVGGDFRPLYGYSVVPKQDSRTSPFSIALVVFAMVSSCYIIRIPLQLYPRKLVFSLEDYLHIKAYSSGAARVHQTIEVSYTSFSPTLNTDIRQAEHPLRVSSSVLDRTSYRYSP